METSKTPQNSEGPRRLVTEKQAAEYLSRKVRTLQKDRLLGAGLPYYKILGSVRYDLSEIEAFLAQCARGPRRGTAA